MKVNLVKNERFQQTYNVKTLIHFKKGKKEKKYRIRNIYNLYFIVKT